MFYTWCRLSPPKPRNLILLLAALSPGLVHAQDLCPPLEDLMQQAKDNFVETITHPELPGAPACDLSQGLGGAREYHCAWAFDYRVPKAAALFEMYDADIRACLADPQKAKADAEVNHPDSYILHQYLVDGTTVAISLKDKAALQETYVFLRIKRP